MAESNFLNFLTAEVQGKINLSDKIFSSKPSWANIKRYIDWQMSNSRQGTRKSKTVSEVSGTGRKSHAQKGSGRARQGGKREVHMRGGATVHGPVVRSHATKLPKKLRNIGLISTISAKFKKGTMVFVDHLKMESISSKQCHKILKQLSSLRSTLLITDSVDTNLHLSCRNIKNCKLLPTVGINVLDLVKYESVVVSTEAVKSLEARLA
ncbi:50S ribosomal protein L4 [Candidatus Sneabacter namystus]|uniref:Large ribosomal subunit protein uL4 n=1 Tax=Candidatus Sneabacter namystus TaxID=2601646 RepID=A0A5C0UI39_9RICK|nr:50S ribosomal protein L4 [Candidatus Sneabacter namystus]QEK39768.1 50S ribosomal protein L4 [Candidatus Sneabacter namystus]